MNDPLLQSASLADLIDLAETFESRANFQRSLAKSCVTKLRREHQGKADAHESDAKLIRAEIARRAPKPVASALRLVTSKEIAHV